MRRSPCHCSFLVSVRLYFSLSFSLTLHFPFYFLSHLMPIFLCFISLSVSFSAFLPLFPSFLIAISISLFPSLFSSLPLLSIFLSLSQLDSSLSVIFPYFFFFKSSSSPPSILLQFSSPISSSPSNYFFLLIFLLHPDDFLFVASCVCISFSFGLCLCSSLCLLLHPALSPNLRDAWGLTCLQLQRPLQSHLHPALWRRIHLFSHASVRHCGWIGEKGRDKRYFIVNFFFLTLPRVS